MELRRRNLIPSDAFPFTTASVRPTTSATTRGRSTRRSSLAGTTRFAGSRPSAERDDRRLGIGVALYVEVTGFGRREHASVEIAPDGTATVRVGTSSQGQGHETAFAQVAAGALGMPIDRVRVLHSDTAEVPRGEGTYGSRSLQIAGTAVFRAAEAVLERARRSPPTSSRWPEDVLATADGGLGVVGSPDHAISWAELAGAADPSRLPEGAEPGLAAEARPRQPDYTYPFGAHVAVVEVDAQTGDVRLLRHVAVDDCGRVLNPMLVQGQVHGGLGQGIAQALFEEVVYDELGTPLTSNLATYAMPAATELPSFERGATDADAAQSARG